MGKLISKLIDNANNLQERYNIFGNRSKIRKKPYPTCFSEENRSLLYSRKYEEIT